MKKEEFFEILGEVDEGYVKQAQNRGVGGVPIWLRWTASAAAVLTAVLILAMMGYERRKPVDWKPEFTEPADTVVTGPSNVQQPTVQKDPLRMPLVALNVGGGSDSANGIGYPSECEFWSGEKQTRFQDDSAPRTRTVSFNGNTYTGTYQYSIVQIPDIYQTDYYALQNGKFAVYHATGKLSLLSIYGKDSGEMTADDCFEHALEAAMQIADVSEYVLTVIPTETLHWYRFERYIGDIQTAERISIGVTTTGEITQLVCVQLGAFDSVLSSDTTVDDIVARSVDALFSSQADDVLNTKINQIYGDLNKKYPDSSPSLSYEVTNSLLVALPDGTLGLLQTVSADVALSIENGWIDHDCSLFQVLVKCEKE